MQAASPAAARHHNISGAANHPRFFVIPGELSGSADYFCRAEAGSFSIASQVGEVPTKVLIFRFCFSFLKKVQRPSGPYRSIAAMVLAASRKLFVRN